MQLKLNSNLDLKSLMNSLYQSETLHIPNIFQTTSAKLLHECLSGDLDWELAYKEIETSVAALMTKNDFLELPVYQQNTLLNNIQTDARHNFQYVYHCYRILDMYLQKSIIPDILIEFIEWINSDDTLSVIRSLTGNNQIIKADAQATRYGPHQFLNKHNDNPDDEHRVFAYVLNLTPNWNPNWGGFLQFYTDTNDISTALIPSFNALNLFKVPKYHAVSFVAPFAGAYRYSITGWFRTK